MAAGAETSKTDEAIEHTNGIYDYKLKDDNTIKITKYLLDEESMTTPKKINGLNVTEIGQYAFQWKFNTHNIVISEGVEILGKSAFEGWISEYNDFAKKIQLPSTLKIIDDRCFYDSGVTRVSLPEGVESIGDMAFGNCYSLTQLYIPKSVIEINDYSFLLCKSLTIFGEEGSYAEEYAIKRNIPFQLGEVVVVINVDPTTTPAPVKEPEVDDTTVKKFQEQLPVIENKGDRLENVLVTIAIIVFVIMISIICPYFKIGKD